MPDNSDIIGAIKVVQTSIQTVRAELREDIRGVKRDLQDEIKDTKEGYKKNAKDIRVVERRQWKGLGAVTIVIPTLTILTFWDKIKHMF